MKGSSLPDKHLQQSGRIQKPNKVSVAFLYANDRLSKETKETTFYDSLKYLDVTLNKQAKDLYNKNVKIVKKKLQKTPEGKVYPAFGSVVLILLKWPSNKNQPTDSMQFPPIFLHNYSKN